MRKYAIITDSTSDLEKSARNQYDIDYVAMNYIINDVEYVASLDWESHSAKEFYDIMRKGTRVFTTQVPRVAYEEKFREWLDKEYDIIYISCSSALSSSINTARIVADELKKEYDAAKIYCIDSLISSLGQGYLAMLASDLRKEGKSIDEVSDAIEGCKLCVNQVGTVGSLEYLRRAGRVKASSAFFGDLFGVKPIIISDRIGQNYAYKKVKGLNNSRRAIAEDIKEAADGVYEDLYISHADCLADAEAVRDEVLKVAPFKNVHIDTIRPIVGASVGPGTIIVFCFGKEVTIEGKE